LKTSPSNTIEIEALIHSLARHGQGHVKSYDLKVVDSISNQISYYQQGLTDKQASLVLKILKNNVDVLNNIYKKDVLEYILNPTYKFPIRNSISYKRISYISENEPQKRIKIEFPYNETIISFVKKERNGIFYSSWSPEDKCWYFSLDEFALKLCLTLVNDYEFEFDENLGTFFKQINEIESNLEQNVPMLDKIENNFQFVNSDKTLQDYKSQNLLDSLFKAKKSGIFLWSDKVDELINRENFDPIVLDFLKHSKDEEFQVDFEKYNRQQFEKFINYLTPLVIFIPAGSELSKTRDIFEILSNAGIKNSEISTMFRLPNETDSNFNKFIKEEKLNSPINENTKAVLLSQKVPKTVLESKLIFNTVITFSKIYVHYATKDFLKNFQNVIELVDKNLPKKTENSIDWLS